MQGCVEVFLVPVHVREQCRQTGLVVSIPPEEQRTVHACDLFPKMLTTYQSLSVCLCVCVRVTQRMSHLCM